jgi:thiamine-phosphate pyrophosphorylase
MFSNFTPAAARALNTAHADGQDGPFCVRLLAALIDEGEGRPALLLEKAGLNLADLLQGLTHGNLACQVEARGGEPSSLEAVLRGARQRARETSTEDGITSEHLLLALLLEDLRLRFVLETGGLDFEILQRDCGLNAGPLPMTEPIDLHAASTDLCRILDAAGNRAREAARVVEDYCRFSRDDALLTKEAKMIRHNLREALASLPAALRIESRETRQDVGCGITTPAEMSRATVVDVARAAFKRLQEGLRSLEEYAKIIDPAQATRFESLRYRTYTLERLALLAADACRRLEDICLCAIITTKECVADLDWTVREAAAGGTGMIQLREKDVSDREVLERARKLRALTHELKLMLIVNDRPDIAHFVSADGVHLGQDDMPVKEARRLLGPDALIGVSTRNLDQVRQAVFDGASYIGFGPTFFSQTKHFTELAGLEFIRQAIALTSLPAFVIGGITTENVAAVVSAGGRRVAVTAALCRASDPRTAATALCRSLKGG